MRTHLLGWLTLAPVTTIRSAPCAAPLGSCSGRHVAAASARSCGPPAGGDTAAVVPPAKLEPFVEPSSYEVGSARLEQPVPSKHRQIQQPLAMTAGVLTCRTAPIARRRLLFQSRSTQPPVSTICPCLSNPLRTAYNFTSSSAGLSSSDCLCKPCIDHPRSVWRSRRLA